MSRQFLCLAGSVLIAASVVLFSASLGASEARAGDCAKLNFTFTLGNAGNPGNFGNTCNTVTSLDATGSFYGLTVYDSTPYSIPILGVYGATTGVGAGVKGETASIGAATKGVEGDLLSDRPGVGSAAVFGFSASTNRNGPGVYGLHDLQSGSAPGVLGYSNALNGGGVRGVDANKRCCGFGVAGLHAGRGFGVFGESPYGFAVSGLSRQGWAGYFQGNVDVIGTLFESSGGFRIDNPLQPARSYLQHSFVESPDMKNIYDGNAVTNANGYATVTLPDYFQALNKDFRYQLTVVGKNHWDAKAAVWQELRNNRFTIRTDQSHTKVSWQVTGIRKDAWANAHRIQVVVPKTGSAEGKYVHPELYGKPMTKSIVVLPGIKPGTQPTFTAPGLPEQK